jgi:hypothetical protein
MNLGILVGADMRGNTARVSGCTQDDDDDEEEAAFPNCGGG